MRRKLLDLTDDKKYRIRVLETGVILFDQQPASEIALQSQFAYPDFITKILKQSKSVSIKDIRMG